MRMISFLALASVLAACGAGLAATSEPGPTATPDPSERQRGPVYVDRHEVLVLESYPVQLVLHVVGNAPTPCHEVLWDVEGPDSEGSIRVDLYSEADPNEACIQVLESFEVRIPLGSFTSGNLSVWLNGEAAGEVTLP